MSDAAPAIQSKNNGLFGQALSAPFLAFLALFVWLALGLYVLLASALGSWRDIILLPALIAAIVLCTACLYHLRHSKLAMTGATLIFFWVIIALLAPLLPLIDPNKPLAPFALPGTYHNDHYFLLGADLKGRDLLSRVIWGCQRVIVWGVTATLSAYVIGVAAGLAAGYWRGYVDTILSFIANIALSFPVMVLFILILNILGPGGFNILIAVAFASAPAIMRITRGLAIEMRELEFVQAAQLRGEHPLIILAVEMLPNMRAPLLVDGCLRLGYTVVAITTLTFLGLGLQPPQPDWGLMIAEAARVAVLAKFAYMILIPAVAVSSLVLGFNLVADGLSANTARGET